MRVSAAPLMDPEIKDIRATGEGGWRRFSASCGGGGAASADGGRCRESGARHHSKAGL